MIEKKVHISREYEIETPLWCRWQLGWDPPGTTRLSELYIVKIYCKRDISSQSREKLFFWRFDFLLFIFLYHKGIISLKNLYRSNIIFGILWYVVKFIPKPRSKSNQRRKIDRISPPAIKQLRMQLLSCCPVHSKRESNTNKINTLLSVIDKCTKLCETAQPLPLSLNTRYLIPATPL